ncbi:hypothetical protein N7478_007511 [Penicillium angulare]|uniref:uncharacterized protein n=1 Tax=Penicillium angulare TaxID=116970 RepID=UPI0025414E35|nr:uncharacterized protein N7478_007511 [Penicillium angulare]KAJ5272386.1 hypothetical protein N7478_007511 [Penicillium angulare]
MCLTMIIGNLTSIPWALSFLFAGGDLEALGSSTQPIMLLFQQATQNSATSTLFKCWLIVIYFGATLSCLAATGRQTWAFARDNGLPFSTWNAIVHDKLRMPVNATIICTIVISLYGIIYVGSTTAFSSFISASILVMNVSYAIPQGIALFRGRQRVITRGQFRLGAFGYFVNGFTVAWVTIMNYVSVVAAGIIFIVSGLWLGGKRRTFTRPYLAFEIMRALDDR